MVKKILLAVLLVGFAVSADWAQDINPQKKVHTRPPYSGPRKNHGGSARPAHNGSHGRKTGHPQPKFDHVVAH